MPVGVQNSNNRIYIQSNSANPQTKPATPVPYITQSHVNIWPLNKPATNTSPKIFNMANVVAANIVDKGKANE